MLRADISFSALGEQAEQRIRQAGQLLAAYRIRAKIRPWDGTRCDLLVTDLSDAYGRKTYDRARSRGTPVLAFGADTHAADDGTSIALDNSLAPVLAQSMRDLLALDARNDDGDTDNETLPALCRLAGNDLKGRGIDATWNGRVVSIRPEEGRVYAPTLSDLLSAIDTFCSEDWSLARSEDGARPPEDGASRSLEAFLLQAAFAARDALPRFPEGRYRLSDWPDVGSAPELVGSLKIAKLLLDRDASPAELARAGQVDAADVNATLWAYAAANLLDMPVAMPKTEPPPQPVRAFSGIMARIAQRFGLVRS